MKFEAELIEAVFQKRYKRFFADVLVDGKLEVAHVPNTGSMKGLSQSGRKCLVAPSKNPERKLKFTLEAIQNQNGNAWVGVNTHHPNQLVKEAFKEKLIQHWNPWDTLQSEVKISAESRIDFVFSKGSQKHFVEVKNVTLEENGVAKFPDAVTERGQRHLCELMDLVKKGNSTEIFFTVQREDCKVFSPADDIDPRYGVLLRQALQAGVLISAYVVKVDSKEIVLTSKKIPVQL